MTVSNLLQTLVLASIGDWFSTFSLIFGGCCSNALALELITTQYPPAGTLITFTQFLLVTLASLRHQLVFKPAPVTHRSATQRIIDDIQNLRRRIPSNRMLNVALQGPGERVAELSDSLRKSTPGLFVIQRSCSRDAQEASCSISNVENGNVVTLADCASDRQCGAKHDLTVILRSFPNSIAEPDRSRKLIILDVSSPDRPVFTYPLPQFSCRLFQFYRYRLKPRGIPLTRYAIQVALFLVINLLNNAAFAYNVPMAVHIIFRSGGLVVNMLLGWILYGRRYSRIQVFSVLLVTCGVALTTLSSTHSNRARVPSPQEYDSQARNGAEAELNSNASFISPYATGIALLAFALFLSGILGHQQDACFAKYGRSHWAEALFYLHALALPLFGFGAPRMAREMRAVSSIGGREGIQIQLSPIAIGRLIPSTPILDYKRPVPLQLALSIPAFYLPLLLNAVTQLLCVAGVNRLTSRVTSLTVTLVLVVRKAVSLAISVAFFNKEGGKGRSGVLLWTGAVLVLAGTVGYTIGSRNGRKKQEQERKQQKLE